MDSKLNWIYLALVGVLAFMVLRPTPQSGPVQVSTPSQALVGTPPNPNTNTSAAKTVGLVSINTASQAELESLPRVGPKLAERIIQGRPYSTLEGLDAVKGIGPKLLEKLKPLVRL